MVADGASDCYVRKAACLEGSLVLEKKDPRAVSVQRYASTDKTFHPFNNTLLKCYCSVFLSAG
jgi:hypothetical protein